MKIKRIIFGTMLTGIQLMTSMTSLASGWNQVSGKWQYVKEDQSCIKN